MENQIELRDISVSLQLIDRAVEKGILRGAELSAVGAVRDKFAVILERAQREAEAEAGEKVKAKTEKATAKTEAA